MKVRNSKLSPRKLLIIDPDTEITSVLISFLREKGIAVNSVSQANQLQSVLAAYQPDALLVDYTPVKPGSRQMWSQIKKDPVSAPLPMVVYSTAPRLQQLQKELGCHRILAKPFDLDTLEASILECF